MDWRPPESPSAASMDSVSMNSMSSPDNPNPYYSSSSYGSQSYNNNNNNNNNNSYGAYSSSSTTTSSQESQLRRRTHHTTAGANYGSSSSSAAASYGGNKYHKAARMSVKRLDFFQKVESDMTVTTDRGGRNTLTGYIIIAILVLAEVLSWRASNAGLSEHVVVDTSLGKKMRVTLNITFPALHCDDLHVDLMDVAGDAHNNIDTESSMVKRRLHLDGSRLSQEEVTAEMNKAHAADEKLLKEATKDLSKDYCGPCYGAHEQEGQCCNTCDTIIDAYKKKRWNYEHVRQTSEQCIREGKTKPKRMARGEGCNLSGHMTFNRVAGNFHIAMGEGVERNGKHIHTFQPDDTQNFNASHIIHELRFGPDFDAQLKKKHKSLKWAGQVNTLDGIRKIVTERDGTTGMFQYFLKIVPTTYKGANVVNTVYPDFQYLGNDDDDIILETNRYFTTEVFKPLIEVEHEHLEIGKQVKETKMSDEGEPLAGVHVGGKSGTSHDHKEHHKHNNAVLPGVFFMYQIYPFAIEVTKESVPLTHLLIRVMATIGGVMTIVGWVDGWFYAREKRQF